MSGLKGGDDVARLDNTSHDEIWVAQGFRLAKKRAAFGLEPWLGDVAGARLDAQGTHASLAARLGVATAGEAACERGAQTCTCTKSICRSHLRVDSSPDGDASARGRRNADELS
jgi:hypothetical protein